MTETGANRWEQRDFREYRYVASDGLILGSITGSYINRDEYSAHLWGNPGTALGTFVGEENARRAVESAAFRNLSGGLK